MRLVKDFDADCKDGKYVVKVKVDENYPAITVYDNRVGNEKDYYSIYYKIIKKIRKNKDCYILYV